jgi:hypothetical protein
MNVRTPNGLVTWTWFTFVATDDLLLRSEIADSLAARLAALGRSCDRAR